MVEKLLMSTLKSVTSKKKKTKLDLVDAEAIAGSNRHFQCDVKSDV